MITEEANVDALSVRVRRKRYIYVWQNENVGEKTNNWLLCVYSYTCNDKLIDWLMLQYIKAFRCEKKMYVCVHTYVYILNYCIISIWFLNRPWNLSKYDVISGRTCHYVVDFDLYILFNLCIAELCWESTLYIFAENIE